MAITDAERKITFHGKGGTLFGIQIVNLLLTIVTLGIYSFWARVKVRKYIWGQLEFEGDRFSFHGTAVEILKGWLKAALFFGIPYILLQQGPQWIGSSPVLIVSGALLSLVLIMFFIPLAVVGSRRYRLSRTAWRGIRFNFRGTWKQYLPIFIGGNILVLLTLGFYSPFYDVRREKFLLSNSYLGNQKFNFDGDGWDLFKSYFLAVILALPTLFFSLFWYHVKRTRYVWSRTTFSTARFHSSITFGGLLKVSVLNLLLVLVTLGFGFSWAEVRMIRYLSDNLILHGPADIEALAQDTQAVTATGEELASFLDLDFDLG
jgi:uncharacterized membrane protein YjgN (DUF898 family)